MFLESDISLKKKGIAKELESAALSKAAIIESLLLSVQIDRITQTSNRAALEFVCRMNCLGCKQL